jgi:uncharacterized protein (DUF1684 family)
VIDVKADEAHRLEIEQWRKAREDALRSPQGWLSLVGLHLLQNGTYTLGSSNDNQIVLPSSVPAHLGTLDYADGRARLQMLTDVPVTVEPGSRGHGTVEHGTGEQVSNSIEMVDNRGGAPPTIITVGSVRFNLHKFGEEVALRVRDSTAPAIQAFKGCQWFKVKPEYNVVGRFVRQDAPTPINVATSVRTTAQYAHVGTVSFELMGKPYALLASPATNPRELFIIFHDDTAGKTTYGAGRYLYAAVDEKGVVTLDFNKAYSPPCAFTPFATCSLPPAQNRLPVAIEAGELT